MFKNENINNNKMSIFQQFFSYQPKTGDGGVDGQLLSARELCDYDQIRTSTLILAYYSPIYH